MQDSVKLVCLDLIKPKHDHNVKIEVYQKLNLLVDHHSCLAKISIVKVSITRHAYTTENRGTFIRGNIFVDRFVS
jgi:hypothetical protein